MGGVAFIRAKIRFIRYLPSYPTTSSIALPGEPPSVSTTNAQIMKSKSRLRPMIDSLTKEIQIGDSSFKLCLTPSHGCMVGIVYVATPTPYSIHEATLRAVKLPKGMACNVLGGLRSTQCIHFHRSSNLLPPWLPQPVTLPNEGSFTLPPASPRPATGRL